MYINPIAWAVINGPADLVGVHVDHPTKGRGVVCGVNNYRVEVAFGETTSRFNTDQADKWLTLVAAGHIYAAVENVAAEYAKKIEVEEAANAAKIAAITEKAKQAAADKAARQEAQQAAAHRKSVYSEWVVQAESLSHSSCCHRAPCRNELNAAARPACTVCGWSICTCGACGSGWLSKNGAGSCQPHVQRSTGTSINDELAAIHAELRIPRDAVRKEYSVSISGWSRLLGDITKSTIQSGVPLRSLISITFRGVPVVINGVVAPGWKDDA